jgi:isopentenyl-diphosphate delta-isomerase
LALADGPGVSGFADFSLVHNCLPGISWTDIDLTTSLAGIKLNHPFIINAITGGADDVGRINGGLAEVARRTGAAMAVGSQYAALENPEVRQSYEIVRQIYPEGVFFANLGAHTTPRQAAEAVAMIGASAIQIHLNVAQEIIMAEGDRDFTGYLDNIAAIVQASAVPVIVKEVGCGIAREQAAALIAAGVRAIDVGGTGGTNFLAIEAARSGASLAADTLGWGIPTAISAAEVAEELPKHVDMVVSGGVRTAQDAVKALALGGKAVGLAGPVIKILQSQGIDAAEQWLLGLIDDMRRLMLLVGAARIKRLTAVPLVITGYSREWLTNRGIDVTKYARRQ